MWEIKKNIGFFFFLKRCSDSSIEGEGNLMNDYIKVIVFHACLLEQRITKCLA